MSVDRIYLVEQIPVKSFEIKPRNEKPTSFGKTVGFRISVTHCIQPIRDTPFFNLSLQRGRCKVKFVSSNDVKGSMTAPRTDYFKSDNELDSSACPCYWTKRMKINPMDFMLTLQFNIQLKNILISNRDNLSFRHHGWICNIYVIFFRDSGIMSH